MSWSLCLELAVKSLRQHRLRSALTLVGITIGVAVVIVMAAIAAGARQSIAQQIQAAGANTIQVAAGNYSHGDQDPGSGDVAEIGMAGGAGMSPEPVPHAARPPKGDGWAGQGISPRLPGRGASTALATTDVAAIANRVDGVRLTSATVNDTAVLAAGPGRLFVRVQGADVDYAAIRGLSVVAGRFVSRGQVVNRDAVLVLSVPAAHELFRGTDPVGRAVNIRRRPFTVIGVVDRPAGLVGTASGPPEVMVPYTAVQDLLGITHLHGIAVSIERAGDATRVARDIVAVLRTAHDLGPDEADDFTVRTQAREAILGKGVNPLVARAVAGSVVNLDEVTLAQIAESLERSGRTMTLLLASVASIALLVGGIGIMNIMLVSVTERTREIGLRLAMGARGRDVLVQFLAEAVTLSVLGGVIGIAIGAGASGGVGRLLRWSTSVSPLTVAVAVSVAAAVGVFFGFYPARQASRLDPIVALRHE